MDGKTEVKMPRLDIDKFLAMTEGEQRFEIYSATCDLIDTVKTMEAQANEMMSGDNMMAMAEKFLGGS